MTSAAADTPEKKSHFWSWFMLGSLTLAVLVYNDPSRPRTVSAPAIKPAVVSQPNTVHYGKLLRFTKVTPLDLKYLPKGAYKANPGDLARLLHCEYVCSVMYYMPGVRPEDAPHPIQMSREAVLSSLQDAE